MKKSITTIVLAAAIWCGLGAPASAEPLVTAGADYSVYIYGTLSGEATVVSGPFDGAATASTRAGLDLSLTESETDLGGGRSRIVIDLSANGDLFPVSGESAYLAMGVFGEALQFNRPVTLEQLLVRFYRGSDVLFQSSDLVTLVSQPSPWNGIIPAPNSAIVFAGIGGFGISRVSYDLLLDEAPVQAVPEPGSLLLGALALALLAGAHRARRRRA